MRILIAAGSDPLEAKRAEQEASKRDAQAYISFADIATDYIESHRAGWKNLKHADQWSNTLNTYAYPVIGKLGPNEVTTAHILEVLNQDDFWLKKPETASRVRNRIELVLDAAKARGLRDGENPARWRGHLDKLRDTKAIEASSCKPKSSAGAIIVLPLKPSNHLSWAARAPARRPENTQSASDRPLK